MVRTHALRDEKELVDVGLAGEEGVAGAHLCVEAADRPYVHLPKKTTGACECQSGM